MNAVAEIDTVLDPDALLMRLHEIEASFGRERATRWAPRTLDLDLLDLGGMVLPDVAIQSAWRALPPEQQSRQAPDDLILPHPRLQDRAFVLVPLVEIDPDWVHPGLMLTARQLLDRLPEAEKAPICPISPPWTGLSALVKFFQTQ
ncbi:2-amino-4-hydroxy-6- hydroxymethyldihydropteridine pyrophosphokinase [Rhodovulum sp. P5]|nr:2-amino-4-hydroxy-6- hydroxymethyldihydropteridine pyrophosphokinase [Rhodovulum sp. P5]